MIKRFLAALLICSLFLGLLTVPVSAAGWTEAFQALRHLVLREGSDMYGEHYISLMLSENTTYKRKFNVTAYADNTLSESKVLVSISDEEYAFMLQLEPTMKTPFQIMVAGRGFGGTISLDPAVITSSYQIPSAMITPYGDDDELTPVTQAVQKDSTASLHDMLACLDYLLKKEGSSVADLGFTKYVVQHSTHFSSMSSYHGTIPCVEAERHDLTCDVCGSKYSHYVDPLGQHTWGKSWISSPATCTSGGTMGYECTVCGEKKYEPIPATGRHTWGKSWISSPAACTSDGAMGYECTVCGEKRYEPIPATGHYWQITEILSPATEEAHGKAKYTCATCGETKEAPLCSSEIFIDAPEDGNWAHAPIDWALIENITKGTSENQFSPEEGCTRAQVVTFLWRAAGKPEVKEAKNPFADVAEGEYYYEPVLWAVQKGITTGTDETHFSPDDTCTRAQIVTFLWRYEGKPEGEAVENPFADVDEAEYYAEPVLWAVANKITTGTSDTTFEPDATCTRAQVVTFLYRDSRLKPAETEDPDQPDPDQPGVPFDPDPIPIGPGDPVPVVPDEPAAE